MCFLASLAGLRAKAHETPLEYCARLALAFPEQAEAIGGIVQTYLETRFSREKQLAEQDEARLRRCWSVLSHALLRRVLRVRLLFGNVGNDYIKQRPATVLLDEK